MKIKHCSAILPSEEEGVELSIYLDYWWRRRNHRHYRSSTRRGSSGRRGSDRRDISSDGWHRGGSNDGRLRHSWRDVLERGRRGDGRHGHCLLRSFQTTKWKHCNVLTVTNADRTLWTKWHRCCWIIRSWAWQKVPGSGPQEEHKGHCVWFAWCHSPEANKNWRITDLSLPTISSRPATQILKACTWGVVFWDSSHPSPALRAALRSAKHQELKEKERGRRLFLTGAVLHRAQSGSICTL